MNQRPQVSAIFSRILELTILLYQALAIAIFGISIYLGSQWLKQPFPGGFFEHTMALSDANSATGESWELYRQGFKPGDQLLAVNGTPVASAADLKQTLAPLHIGETITLQINKRDQSLATTEVTLIPFSAEDRLAFFVIPFLISAAFLLVSLWIFGFRRTEPAGRAFTLLATSFGIATGALFNLYTTHQFTYAWTFALTAIVGALINLTLVFPQEARIVIRRPYLRYVGYLITLALTLNAFRTLFNFKHPTDYIYAWQWIYVAIGLSAIFYLGILGYRAFRSPSPIVKNQARTILTGSLLAFAPIVVWFLLSPLQIAAFNPYILLFLIAFPLVNGIVILRYRLIRTDYWLRQGIVYSLLIAFVVMTYGLLVSGLGLISASASASKNPFLIGALIFFIAILLDPLRKRLQTLVNRSFFRGSHAHEEQLKIFSHDLTNALSMDAVSGALRRQIFNGLAPEQVHIYAYDALSDQYAALPDSDGRPSSDIYFASNSPIVRYFQQEKIPLYLDAINPPAIFQTEEARLSLLAARLFVALPGEEKPIGWIALSAQRSGEAYTPHDLEFLEQLANQSSIAISRVQTVLNLERRVQEMNALTRVSQGVNITLTFDDVLELIFAQASQIIPSTHFHITLYNKTANYFYFGFCVDDRERIASRENKPFPARFGLGQEIIRTGRTLLTQDYLRECQTHNATPASPGIYAWMGVPLNTGAETIGALSVGSHNASVAYTRVQLDLLQAIADQTVGAIVKARLLEETQQRASQLAALNEVTRQLTSTLEQETLLQYILENAVNILNCEAGTLFLMDDQTGELEFRVTIGPVAGNLLGQRIPIGRGIVGRAVQTRAPIIENDAQHSAMRFDSTDKQTGFISRSLLAAPMLIKDRVLGVIEVINRKDELPFAADDQDLLTAFAGQAAVTIENARLIALTDQELSDRVEELSAMGRIVRELNASLDVDRAMRITLEWALRESGAEAGLIGMFEKSDLHIMAQEGYEDLLANVAKVNDALAFPAIKSAIESGQPNQVSLLDDENKSILPGAHMQFIVPIRREANAIGLILLESMSDSQGNLGFLNRLSDNAAIAIYNAQLYDEVQKANSAKSEFVSLVAHELKNPMTSIKGYSELLASGAVGQINEMQTNFLGTIRANVERMSALVSDLNDQAKIEAGRLRLDFNVVDLSEVADEVIRSTKRQVEEKHQEIELDLPQELPKVWADRLRVVQALTNLVSNANKYTSEGGTIYIGAARAENQWDPEGTQEVAHIWVRDNGIGISAEDQIKIFTKFFRSDDMKARESPGTGLGLNITKSLIEMQGGQIWFESEFRKGTTFHFTIPIAEGVSQP
ncbi:MAG: hypothetical protein B6D38_13050 [Anaerolineae bacterium UTCFX1]|jgi:signal transduction histidine kinase/putative methionine-R-sulfoxide reductase with GAF domain/MFS family permease|nr:MAG: hypothetical protein B6D38_13050 [Anaerolineae bacterium UTCFX1]